ncbi:MAG TPA: alpha/beta hydrolase [Candidatus Dormibacteraeota bacterium]|nr:alpha/beta hydrolase [Candidatus Dormibacteraeota bacterium]
MVAGSMRLELVAVPTGAEPLHGLYYEPTGVPVTGAVLIFHGNQSNFYVGPPAFLPPHLTGVGLACLAFNRRGHDILATHRGREPVGGAFQTTAQALEDDELAGCYLRQRGHPAPVVIGHSNGGTLAVRYVADHPETPALVLLSAHCGGTRVHRKISELGLFAGNRLQELTARARELVAAGRGRELMLLPGWWHAISAESFLDYLTGPPDLLELAPEVRCPVLFLRGAGEDRELYPADEFARRAGGPCRVIDLEGCDHWYNGHDEEVGRLVSRWLSEVLGREGRG